MRKYAAFVMLPSLAVQWGCSRTVLVPVPPRMDLKNYGTLGIGEFASNSDPAINSYATQQFPNVKTEGQVLQSNISRRVAGRAA